MDNKVYLIKPDYNYEGFSLVAAENAASANELIASFKEMDYNNRYNSYGYCYVCEDDVIEELRANRKGFIIESIYYSLN